MGRAVAAVLDGGDVDAADAADAAVVEAVMDLSNRPYLENGVEFRDEFIGDLSAEMIDHLFMSVTANGQMTVHLVQHAAGKSDGDLAVAAARAFGRCLRQCVAVDPRRAGAVASSKGTLSV
jgi:imidazoleglycerol-phosphate dehydratase